MSRARSEQTEAASLKTSSPRKHVARYSEIRETEQLSPQSIYKFKYSTSCDTINQEIMSSSSQPAENACYYFCKEDFSELGRLEKKASKVPTENLAKASDMLQQALSGWHYAFFGGWSVRLRGGSRRPRDIDIVVGAESTNEIRDRLSYYPW